MVNPRGYFGYIRWLCYHPAVNQEHPIAHVYFCCAAQNDPLEK